VVLSGQPQPCGRYIPYRRERRELCRACGDHLHEVQKGFEEEETHKFEAAQDDWGTPGRKDKHMADRQLQRSLELAGGKVLKHLLFGETG